MSAIRLENLVKRFGAFTALKTMDLTIADGEFMALLGPSGCGKSTTMNMIAGMEQPTEGRILFGDRDMAGVPMGRRGVGFVFQNYAIFTHMTVRQNLDYGLRMHGRPAAEIDRRVGGDGGVAATDADARPACGGAVGQHPAARGDRAVGRSWSRRSSCSTSRCRTSMPRFAR